MERWRGQREDGGVGTRCRDRECRDEKGFRGTVILKAGPFLTSYVHVKDLEKYPVCNVR